MFGKEMRFVEYKNRIGKNEEIKEQHNEYGQRDFKVMRQTTHAKKGAEQMQGQMT